ncbi:Aste57867_22526 [Aphanomyces stellatus]|uniref:Aste57867_22526 protein n=1 Tax=Aphanomyces stellatus TaxID=120398 RepID=A0A485LL63_9STRA|nr:hypothetical protein As57867_022456 [Aphanomyces stellatus]VFT99186.1 Aste57867_22526 [Aphanomyces stellatus]
MLRYCQPNDWKYFDRLLGGATPVVCAGGGDDGDMDAPLRPSALALRPPSPLALHRNAYWSRSDKQSVLVLWRAWKRYVRRRSRLRGNVMWMMQRRSRPSWLQWRRYVAYRQAKRDAVAASAAAVQLEDTHTTQLRVWRMWRHATDVEHAIQRQDAWRTRRRLRQSWTAWLDHKVVRRDRRHHAVMALHLFLHLKWRQWKRGFELRRHRSLQAQYMLQWRTKRRLHAWHRRTRELMSLDCRCVTWTNGMTLEILRHLWRRWRQHHDDRRRHCALILVARTRRLARRWRDWVHGITIHKHQRHRQLVAESHYELALRATGFHRWRGRLALVRDQLRFGEKVHRHTMLASAWRAFHALLARRDAQCHVMAAFRGRQALAQWCDRVTTKQRVRQHERTTKLSLVRQRTHRLWIAWRCAFAIRQQEHIVDGVYAHRLVHTCVRHWKQFLDHEQAIRVRRLASLNEQRTRLVRDVWAAWKQFRVQQEWTRRCVAAVRRRHDSALLGHVLSQLALYTRWQQRQRYCMQQATAHYATFKFTRRVPLALYAWRAVVDDAHALEALWTNQVREMHRHYTRKMVLRHWHHVAQRQRLAQRVYHARQDLWVARRLRAWRRYVRDQQTIRASVHMLASERQRRRVCCAWNAWRNLAAQTTAARAECESQYMRRRLVGLLTCFVTWVQRYRHRKWLWRHAVPFRTESLHRQTAALWHRWREVFAGRQAQHARLASMIRKQERRTLLAHLVAWRRHTWLHQQTTIFQHRQHETMKRTHFLAWAYLLVRRRYIQEATRAHLVARARFGLRQGVRQWRWHLERARVVQTWQVETWRTHAVKRWYDTWRAHFQKRRLDVQGLRQQRLATLRQRWLKWKVMVDVRCQDRQALVDARTWHCSRLQCAVFWAWHRYFVARQLQRQTCHRADDHHRRFHLRASVAKLYDQWYLHRLLLSVDHQSITKHFRAWAGHVTITMHLRNRAASFETNMQRWTRRLGVRRWRERTIETRRQRLAIRQGQRHNDRHVLAMTWRRWRDRADIQCPSGQAISPTTLQIQHGLSQWKRFHARQHLHKSMTRMASQHSRKRRLGSLWRSWAAFVAMQHKAKQIVTRRRRQWLSQWRHIVLANALGRLRDRNRLRLVLHRWAHVQHVQFQARLGLFRLLERLALTKVVRAWRDHLDTETIVRHAVARRHHQLVATTFHAWYRSLTLAVLGRYHATQRRRRLLGQLLRRWSQATACLRKQRAKRTRVCQIVLATWFAFTYVAQATAGMRRRRDDRVALACVVRWKQRVYVAQYVRLARRKRMRRLWQRWCAYVGRRREKTRVFDQLWGVLQNERATQHEQRSRAYEQTKRMQQELRETRTGLRRIVQAWQDVTRASELVCAKTIQSLRRDDIEGRPGWKKS